MFVTWRIHMCDMAQSYVWHESYPIHEYVIMNKAKEPCILSKEPYILSKEPYILPK